MNKLKTFLLLILICGSLHAQALELKNMMPNSWQKLTRLSEEEEKEFLNHDSVINEIKELIESEFEEYSLEEINIQVFTETNLGFEFFRILICVNPLETIYNKEYKNKILTSEECLLMQSKKECIWQIVFMKHRNNDLKKILIRSYAEYWASQGKWEGYIFNDLMIKPLNENEIGFFITEVSVSFTVDREKMSQNIVPINYNTCKEQLVGSNSIHFSKYNIDEDLKSAWNKDGVEIQASTYLVDSKCPLKYSIQNAFDGNPATSYVENTEDDLMKIVFRKIPIRKELQIDFMIINGYAASLSLYNSNNRIKKSGLKNSDNEPFLVQLNDNDLTYQIKSINRPVDAYTGLFEFIVEEIYLGEKYSLPVVFGGSIK